MKQINPNNITNFNLKQKRTWQSDKKIRDCKLQSHKALWMRLIKLKTMGNIKLLI